MACSKCEKRRKWLIEQRKKAGEKFKTLSVKRRGK